MTPSNFRARGVYSRPEGSYQSRKQNMTIKLTPYDPICEIRTRAMAALRKLGAESIRETAAAVTAFEPIKQTYKCGRADCQTRFERNIASKIFCSQKCMTVMKVRRHRSKQEAALV